MNPWDMTPRKAAHALALTAAYGVALGRRPGTPGEMVERQPEDVRALLRELRSNDLADVAPHVLAWMCAGGQP